MAMAVRDEGTLVERSSDDTGGIEALVTKCLNWNVFLVSFHLLSQ